MLSCDWSSDVCSSDLQHEEERENESRTTPRTTVRGTDNSRLLESRDTRIPDNVGTLTRTSDASRKRASPPQEGLTSRKRQAAPPGSPRTHVRSPVTRIIILVPRGTSRRYQGTPGSLPYSHWILQRMSYCLLVIVLSITDCKQQRSVRKLQGAVQTPMQLARFARRIHSTYTIVLHRSMYPLCSLPNPVRPLQIGRAHV